MITKPHQMLTNGTWECPVIAKLVDERTPREDGTLGCGHCIHQVLDANGEKVVWTIIEQFAWRTSRNDNKKG